MSNAFPFPFAPFAFVPSASQDSEVLRQVGGLPGVKEFLMLRQVHALEHATVWTLPDVAKQLEQTCPGMKISQKMLGGLSTERGFYLYGQIPLPLLWRSVRLAQRRLVQGEWNLAIHPRCGTNLSVEMVLTIGLTTIAHWVAPRGFLEQLASIGLAATTAACLAPEVGAWVQQNITTAIPFNLAVTEIYPTQDDWGRSAYFVGVRWVEC